MRVVETEANKLDLRLERAIRLTFPIDNTDVFPVTPFARYQSPLRVEWEPVPEAIRYIILVMIVDATFNGISEVAPEI